MFFTFKQGYGWPLLLLVAAAALTLTVLFYRRVFSQLLPKQRRLLLLLRFLAIVIVLFLLFRPVVSFERNIPQRKHIVFLVDSSASMATSDDSSGANRFDQARTRVLDWWGKLGKEFDLDLLEFSERASALASPADLARVKPAGKATSLSRALVAAGEKVKRRDLEAVVLLSDGINNAAGDPVQAARNLGATVHTIGVGNSLSSYRDIQVASVECPNEVPLNNLAQVKAFIEARGFDGTEIEVLLEEEGKILDRARLVIGQKDDKKEAQEGARKGPQEVTLQFVPTVKGRHSYTVRVPLAPDEKIAENNQRLVSMQVIDVRMRVLYLEGKLRPEYGALVDRFLSKDTDIEFYALVRRRGNDFIDRTTIKGMKLDGIPSDPAIINKFDVFMIGDLDSSYLQGPRMELIKKRVQDGGGLVMIGGENGLGPGHYTGTPLDETLPLKLGGDGLGQVTDPFLPVLTPDGRQHPIFANIAGFFPTQAGEAQIPGLPPLLGCTRVAGARPGAMVLAVNPTATAEGDKPMPVLAIGPFGKGRVAVFTGDTTRSWQQVPRALDQKSPFLRFWGQLVRWLANRNQDLKAGIEVRTDKGYYDPDAPVTITAIVRDKDGEGVGTAQVTARVKNPEGKEDVVPLALIAGPAGHYEGSLEPKMPGTYEIVAEARLVENTLKADKLVIEVGRPNLEFERLDLDVEKLKALAAAAGGNYWHLSNADRLVAELDRKERRRHVVLEQPLYWPPGFWMVFVGVLAAEWLLRKKNQLR